MSKEQFNVTIQKTLAERIKKDAVRNCVSLGDLASVIFEDFFSSFSLTERARFYSRVGKKRTGRPVVPRI